jgi:hypothetical protein
MILKNFEVRTIHRSHTLKLMPFILLVLVMAGSTPNLGNDARSLLFLDDEAGYLSRIESMRNEQGLYRDRRSDPTVISTAATGLGVLALAEASSRGLRDQDATKTMVRSAFRQTVKSNSERNRGWLSHFTDASGIPKSSSEVSTIDTAIFYAGLLQASRLLKDHILETEICLELARIDLPFVMRDGVFLHGFFWREADMGSAGGETQSSQNGDASEPQFILHRWNDSSEGVILYHLFGLPFPMQITRIDYPLFVYAYPLCFFDDPVYDRFLQDAIENQIARLGYWGVTATDGPKGYVTLDCDVISPVLIGGIATRYPHYLESLSALKIQAATGSMHLPTGWTSSDDLTIDLSSAYILFSRWSRQRLDIQDSRNTDLQNMPSAPPKEVAVEATAS